ncbi:hypothetical protein LCGC14_3120400, partial [marine sediment metagenome]
MVTISSIKAGGAFTVATWTSELCDSSLDGLSSSDNRRWGLLEWTQTVDSPNFVRVDILNSSDVVLIGNLEPTQNSNPRSIELSNIGEIGETQDIKLRFKLYRKTGTCKVQDIHLNKKVKKMVLTTKFLEEMAQWAGSQIAAGGTSVTAAPNRITFGIGTATPSEALDLAGGNLITTGTITSGDITIFDATPILVFKDSNSLGAASVGFIEWKDSGGGRAGFFGNSSSGNG